MPSEGPSSGPRGCHDWLGFPFFPAYLPGLRILSECPHCNPGGSSCKAGALQRSYWGEELLKETRWA